MLSLPHNRHTPPIRPLLSIFMRLDCVTGQLSAFYPAQVIPIALQPSQSQNWFAHLAEQEKEWVRQIIADNRGEVIRIDREGESWLLEFVPDTYPLWLICAHPLTITDEPTNLTGLQMLKADLIAHHSADIERNKRLLQHLKQQSGCDRLILWRYDDHHITPLHIQGASRLPVAQPLDIRYTKMLRKRSSIGFSEPTQVPMLQSQYYLLEDGIQARLDVPIYLPATSKPSVEPQIPVYLLTLEYTSIQSNFSDQDYQQAEQIASLLLHTPVTLEDQPLSDLDVDLIQTTGLHGNAYWQSLSRVLLRHEERYMVVLLRQKKQLYPYAMTDKVVFNHHHELLTALAGYHSTTNLTNCQLNWLCEALGICEKLTARCYPLQTDNQGEPGAILVWGKQGENRWQGVDSIMQLTSWHSMAELATNTHHPQHAEPGRRARFRGCLCPRYRKPLTSTGS